MDTILGILIAFVLLFFLCVIFISERNRYPDCLIKSKTNPYTYYCRMCGQRFDTFGVIGCSCQDKIEPVGEYKDKNCSCVKKFLAKAEVK